MPGTPIALVVGLGNPGKEYAQTRHNAGFWFVDELARRHGGAWRAEPRFTAELARVRVGAAEVWLAKPQAFMNRSGGVTAAVANFYRIPATAVLVAHDELDLPLGAVRLKEGGGAGGHNGLRDLIVHLSDGFWRLRLGIGRPATSREGHDYVLTRASSAEQPLLDDGIAAAADIVPVMLEQGAQAAMQKLHTRGT